jgi:hypothetical protein
MNADIEPGWKGCYMMTRGMHILKISVVAAALLSLLVNAQCVARCAAMPCDKPASSSADLPPCHRHPTPAPKPCTPALFAVDARSHSASPVGAFAFVALVESAAPTVRQPASQAPVPSPPLDSGGPSLTILRL